MPRCSLPFHWREHSGEFENARSARGVVVRTGMDLTNLRRRQGIVVTATKMIVVGADDHVLIAFAGKIREHVVDGGTRRFNIDIERNVQLIGNAKDCGLVA